MTNNLKWIKDLNMRPKTIKLLEENVEGNDIEFEMNENELNFSDVMTKAQTMKDRQFELIKVKCFCISTQYQQSSKTIHTIGKMYTNYI